MDLGLAGRRAAVAAASSGLGLAVARSLASEGATVAMCSRDRRRIEAAAATIGGATVPLVADVSRPEGASGFVTAAQEAMGKVDILVTNAGGPPTGTFASTPVDAYAEAFALNAMSVVAMCKAAVPPMQERRWGRVVAVTSIAVRQPIGNLILSNTARAGATGFLKTLALEVAPDGVTVNSVQPGLHLTDRLRALDDGVDDLARSVPAGELGDPADFGAVVAFLCSRQAGFVTGVGLPVDGGAHRGLM